MLYITTFLDILIWNYLSNYFVFELITIKWNAISKLELKLTFCNKKYFLNKSWIYFNIAMGTINIYIIKNINKFALKYKTKLRSLNLKVILQK